MSCWEISPKTKSGINELSPRKFPRSPILSPSKPRQNPVIPPKTPPQWKKPEEVMRNHRLRIKQNALTARMKSSDLFQRTEDSSLKPISRVTNKRSNPFRCGTDSEEVPAKRIKELNEETQSDAILLQLMGLTPSQESDNNLLSFAYQLDAESDVKKEKYDHSKVFASIPVDWTLRYKMRFISSVPFPWNQTLKTCEEASGVTGFVRCIEDERCSLKGLNSSPSVDFHQCCFYWQHPHLPWLELFPRTHLRRTDNNKAPLITLYPQIKDSLHTDWSESFRSLFQLVRARHCPYFYLVANSFSCLFRAAGINGSVETNVIISPTTRGFRKLLTDEGIDFSMPLKAKNKKNSQNFDLGEDETLDEDDDGEGPGETSDWLASLGVEEEEIKKISNTEANNEFNTEKNDDGNDESLIYIEGFQVNALFNFLINCRKITVTTGPLAGVPPTLISPVAFQGGTLSSLKVRESTVKMDNENFFSLEIRGPLLPHAVHNLCNVLKNNIDRFSITFANLEYSKAFSIALKKIIDDGKESGCDKKVASCQAFSLENLSDCGLKSQILSSFCSIEIQQFDSIKYTENAYVCS